MSKIFLCTHAGMASGMKSSVDFLLGESACLTTLDAYLPDSPDLQETLNSFLDGCDAEESVLLVSDILAGSVNQIMLRASAGRKNVFVIAGVNLSLLQELVLNCGNNFTAESLDEIIADAREMVKRVTLDNEDSGGSFF